MFSDILTPARLLQGCLNQTRFATPPLGPAYVNAKKIVFDLKRIISLIMVKNRSNI